MHAGDAMLDAVLKLITFRDGIAWLSFRRGN
jgi:hypothetical protein